jgi:peptidoglycan hydrolase CwlO-like protein
MSFQAISFVLFNGITSTLFFKYIFTYVYEKITKEREEEKSWLLTKINRFENEIKELYQTIDELEEKLQKKENLLKESSEVLFNKLDNFIIGNYDTIQKENV